VLNTARLVVYANISLILTALYMAEIEAEYPLEDIFRSGMTLG
jgi:hypothetical protein